MGQSSLVQYMYSIEVVSLMLDLSKISKKDSLCRLAGVEIISLDSRLALEFSILGPIRC